MRPVDMRALTVWQPWASLIVSGPKRIENRKRKPWARLLGQLVGIHAAKRVERDIESRYSARYELPTPLPQGALLGVARIVDTVAASDDPWFAGPVGIRLADVVAFPKPLPMKGAQGYWSVLDTLNPGQREHWPERAAMRSQDGTMTEEWANWWALYDVLRQGALK